MIQDTGKEGELLVAKSERGHRPINGVRSSKNGQNFFPQKVVSTLSRNWNIFSTKKKFEVPPSPSPHARPLLQKIHCKCFYSPRGSAHSG